MDVTANNCRVNLNFLFYFAVFFFLTAKKLNEKASKKTASG